MSQKRSNEDKKYCIICGREFTRNEFPNVFDRMKTCGDIVCAGRRRYEKYRERYLKRRLNKRQ